MTYLLTSPPGRCSNYVFCRKESLLLLKIVFNFSLARSTPPFLRGDLKCKHVVLFIFRTEFLSDNLYDQLRSSFRGGTLYSILTTYSEFLDIDVRKTVISLHECCNFFFFGVGQYVIYHLYFLMYSIMSTNSFIYRHRCAQNCTFSS